MSIQDDGTLVCDYCGRAHHGPSEPLPEGWVERSRHLVLIEHACPDCAGLKEEVQS